MINFVVYKMSDNSHKTELVLATSIFSGTIGVILGIWIGTVNHVCSPQSNAARPADRAVTSVLVPSATIKKKTLQ